MAYIQNASVKPSIMLYVIHYHYFITIICYLIYLYFMKVLKSNMVLNINCCSKIILLPMYK